MSQEKRTLNPKIKEDKQELIIQLAALMGKQIDPNDEKALQVAEAFLVADAAKAYALTKIHGISLEFCQGDQDLKGALELYQNSASKIIALGKIYYDSGINVMVGDQRMKQSKEELNQGLEDMLIGIRKEYESLDEKNISRKCDESTKALKMLSQLYGG